MGSTGEAARAACVACDKEAGGLLPCAKVWVYRSDTERFSGVLVTSPWIGLG